SHTLPERLAFEQLRDDERRIDVRADIEHGKDVRVVYRRGRARFLFEAAEPVGVGGDGDRENLDGHIAAQARVAGAIDLAHPASAEGTDNLVRAEANAGGQGHACGL